ncbi:MAG: hypothetical protein AAF329_14415 [Cyanobacteria bacterium P01_A01_bin.17]
MVETQQNLVPTRKPIISIVVTPELKADLEAWAEEEGRTVSNLGERVLSKAVKKWKAQKEAEDSE